jgi:2-hydroxychromene-2-carboxylate isomerase
MNDVLEFWFDFSSPYGYFASLRVDEIAAKAGRRVLWRPFMLGSVFKQTGAQPLIRIPIKGEYCRHDWDRLGRYYRVPWVLPDPFPIATLAVARAFYWLESRDAECAGRFAAACYHAYFGEGRDISAPAVVADVAAALAIDPSAVAAAAAAPEWKQKLQAIGDEAVARGVCGSPFFIVDGEGFWGSDRLDMVGEWLARGGW